MDNRLLTLCLYLPLANITSMVFLSFLFVNSTLHRIQDNLLTYQIDNKPITDYLRR